MLSLPHRSPKHADHGDLTRAGRPSLSAVPRLTTHTVSVMGTEIFYEEAGHGTGRPLVLLHGLSDSHRTWRSVVTKLAQHRRVITPDLPGCGLSGRPDASYSLDWQAKVMAAWLEALDLHDVDMVGHSYGGGVAQYMLLLQPQRIRRLALVAAGGLGREVSFELRLASLPRVVEQFGQPFMSLVAVPALRAVGGVVSADEVEWLREVNRRPGTARAFARTVRDVINWRGQTRHFLDRASEIAQLPPTALFWGSKDHVIPYAQAQKTAQMLRGATLSEFAGCGHFPHHECPDRFVTELTAFLDAPTAQPVHLDLAESSAATSLRYRFLRAPVVLVQQTLRAGWARACQLALRKPWAWRAARLK